MKNIINELQYPETTDFGAKPGDFNVLNVPKEIVQPDTFFNQYNKPFLESALYRNDVIVGASTPTADNLYRGGKLSGFGMENQYLADQNLTFNSEVKQWVPNLSANRSSSVIPEEVSGAALTGAWVVGSMVQYHTFGQNIGTGNQGKDLAGVYTNPLSLITMQSDLQVMRNGSQAMVNDALNSQSRYIDVYYADKANGGSFAEAAAPKAHAYMQAELTQAAMGNSRYGLTPEQRDKLNFEMMEPGHTTEQLYNKYIRKPNTNSQPVYGPALPPGYRP